MAERKIPYLDRSLDNDVPELRDYLNKGAKVLDVGCGPGTITCGVAEVVNPGEVVGIDVKDDMIRQAAAFAAESGADNVTYRLMDTHALDFPDQTFDVVFSHTAAHGFQAPVEALREQKRVTRRGGWVIAAGVRDWGLVPRYPPTPIWDSVYEAWAQHYDFRCSHPEANKPLPLGMGHPQAGRRCAEWFTAAGLDDLRMQVKVHRVQYAGAEETGPHPIDLLPYGGDDEDGWYAVFDEAYEAMVADGFIDWETLAKATEEAKSWYEQPGSFHFWATIFAAGRA